MSNISDQDIAQLDLLIAELQNTEFYLETELNRNKTNQEDDQKMTPTLAYELFGESIDINDKPSTETTQEVLITKKERAGFDKETKMKFLEWIKAEQQPLF